MLCGGKERALGAPEASPSTRRPSLRSQPRGKVPEVVPKGLRGLVLVCGGPYAPLSPTPHPHPQCSSILCPTHKKKTPSFSSHPFLFFLPGHKNHHKPLPMRLHVITRVALVVAAVSDRVAAHGLRRSASSAAAEKNHARVPALTLISAAVAIGPDSTTTTLFEEDDAARIAQAEAAAMEAEQRGNLQLLHEGMVVGFRADGTQEAQAVAGKALMTDDEFTTVVELAAFSLGAVLFSPVIVGGYVGAKGSEAATNAQSKMAEMLHEGMKAFAKTTPEERQDFQRRLEGLDYKGPGFQDVLWYPAYALFALMMLNTSPFIVAIILGGWLAGYNVFGNDADFWLWMEAFTPVLLVLVNFPIVLPLFLGYEGATMGMDLLHKGMECAMAHEPQLKAWVEGAKIDGAMPDKMEDRLREGMKIFSETTPEERQEFERRLGALVPGVTRSATMDADMQGKMADRLREGIEAFSKTTYTEKDVADTRPPGEAPSPAESDEQRQEYQRLVDEAHRATQEAIRAIEKLATAIQP